MLMHYILCTLLGIFLGWAGRIIFSREGPLVGSEVFVWTEGSQLPDGKQITAKVTLTPREVLALEVCLDRLDQLGMPGYAAKARESARSASEKLQAAFLPRVDQ